MSDTPEITYTDDSGPGITREKESDGWAYFTPKGKRITDEAEIERLNKVGLPPAYVNCWFNPDPENEKKIKDETKGTVRCIPLDQPEGQSGTCVYTGEPAKVQVIFSVAY